MHRHFGMGREHRGRRGWGDHMRHVGREGHRGRGRMGRLFDHGDLRFVILALLEEQPRHGYELIKELEDRTGGAYRPSAGVIYPTLTMLEELGHIRPAEGDGTKKAYAVTEEGSAFLAANRAALDQVLERMAAAAAAFGGGPAPEILRAMHNLRLALRIRLGRGPLDAAAVRAVTEILDRAAAEVEKH